MKKSIYYNDNDRHAVAAPKALMAEGYISGGDVDDRSIEDVRAEDLTGYTTCHFFAGQGGWALALRLAGWPDDRPVWTASLPCQPFSSAGKRKGAADERHLWPTFFRLIEACRPAIVFGEQVASSEVVGTQLEAAFVVAVQGGDYARANKLARRLAQSRSFHYWPRWLDGIQADLAGADYAVRAAVLGAHSVHAPHVRQRLFWVADALPAGRAEGRTGPGDGQAAGGGPPGGLDDADGRKPGDGQLQRGGEHGQQPEDGGPGGGLGHAGCERLEGGSHDPRREQSLATQASASGFWADSILIPCRDGKWRRVPDAESLLQRLADGLPASLGDMLPASGFPLAGKIEGRQAMLRLIGNSIVPQVAAAFVKAYMDAQAGGTRD